MPWEPSSFDSATKIAHKLSFLPLALLHAGKAVMKHLCSLNDYLDYYERSWTRIRKARKMTHQHNGQDDVFNMNVYSTYEILFRGLENTPTTAARDAVELLKIFSFMSNQEIRFDMLIAAVRHPQLQEEHEILEKRESDALEKDKKKKLFHQRRPLRRLSIQLMKEWLIWAIGEVYADRGRPGMSIEHLSQSHRESL